jgi:hypothetical protein
MKNGLFSTICFSRFERQNFWFGVERKIDCSVILSRETSGKLTLLPEDTFDRMSGYRTEDGKSFSRNCCQIVDVSNRRRSKHIQLCWMSDGHDAIPCSTLIKSSIRRNHRWNVDVRNYHKILRDVVSCPKSRVIRNWQTIRKPCHLRERMTWSDTPQRDRWSGIEGLIWKCVQKLGFWS